MDLEKLENIAEIEFLSQELDNQVTIVQFLKELLCLLWEEGEEFSGKRPFGNSGWQYEIYGALIENGIIDGTLDEFGYVDELSDKSVKIADQIIYDIIIELM